MIKNKESNQVMIMLKHDMEFKPKHQLITAWPIGYINIIKSPAICSILM